mmetsp:Transcript_14024/g.24581  ORF Transcript_14024/g.24581 Transcript_14024/m.24581 type:complete len:164 (-) Transcript_14024:146-637(-)
MRGHSPLPMRRQSPPRMRGHSPLAMRRQSPPHMRGYSPLPMRRQSPPPLLRGYSPSRYLMSGAGPRVMAGYVYDARFQQAYQDSLRQGYAQPRHSSPPMRGYEDDIPSRYHALPPPGRHGFPPMHGWPQSQELRRGRSPMRMDDQRWEPKPAFDDSERWHMDH